MAHETRVRRRDWLKVAAAAAVALAACGFLPAQSGKSKPFRFVQMSDPQLGFGGYEHDVKAFEQAVRQINALKPDFVVICGDLVDRADDKSFADFNRIRAGFAVPCFCVPGNHDVGAQPAAKSLQRFRKVVGKDYHSFEHKGCVFVFVNTQLWKAPVEGESEKQEQWLAATLKAAAKKKQPVFVVGHHPLFTKSADEEEKYENLSPETRKRLLDLFGKAGVVAVLGGHTHKLVLNDHEDIQLVNVETTSKNFDKRPAGFRLWHVGNARPLRHDFIPLEEF